MAFWPTHSGFESRSGQSNERLNHRVAAGDVEFIFRVVGNSACIFLLSGIAMDYTDSEQGQHELMQAENDEHYSVPEGYAEMMDRLGNPDCWDVPGLISDTAERLRRESIDGEMLAVIDTLTFRMADICKMIDAEEKPNYEIISKVYEVAARLTISR